MDVGEDPLVPRLEPDEDPPEASLIHRLRLLVREKLGLDEAPQPELHPEVLLRLGDQVHKLHDLWIHVQLIIVKHEAGDAISLVELDNLLDDVLGGPHPDPPQKRAHTPAAEPTAEGTAELRDHRQRAHAV